jgi:hypothetical protein
MPTCSTCGRVVYYQAAACLGCGRPGPLYDDRTLPPDRAAPLGVALIIVLVSGLVLGPILGSVAYIVVFAVGDTLGVTDSASDPDAVFWYFLLAGVGVITALFLWDAFESELHRQRQRRARRRA